MGYDRGSTKLPVKLYPPCVAVLVDLLAGLVLPAPKGASALAGLHAAPVVPKHSFGAVAARGALAQRARRLAVSARGTTRGAALPVFPAAVAGVSCSREKQIESNQSSIWQSVTFV